MKKSLLSVWMLLFLLPSIVIAQTASTCPDIVNLALQAADEFCTDLKRNTVCYGNVRLEATPQDDVTSFYFERIGDIAPVNHLASLRISPMNIDAGEWGVAVMALQANLPDTLPGQNVTFVLFGDVTLENATTSEQIESGAYTPMQAFYLTTGIGDSRCDEAPDSGMLVQTPKGVGEIVFNVNGVDVIMGSTVFFQASNTNQLTAATIEGSAVLKIGDDIYPVLAGTRFGIEIGEAVVQTFSDLPQDYSDIVERLNVLPLGLLERQIQIHPPLDDEMLDELHRRIQAQLPLCGQPPFPPCNESPALIGGQPCVFPENYPDNRVPLDMANHPICLASQFFGQMPPINIMPPIDDRPCVYPPGPNDPPLPPNETRPFCADLGTLVPPPINIPPMPIPTFGSNIGHSLLPTRTPTQRSNISPRFTPTPDPLSNFATPTDDDNNGD